MKENILEGEIVLKSNIPYNDMNKGILEKFKELSGKRLPLYYKDKIIGYSTYDIENNTITNVVTDILEVKKK